MKRINVLDAQTSNKIAAGEVVERPASVVKELLENSIDAEASNITIEIADGGQKGIKITDDGHGIHPDDVEKAFMTHATSKINSIDDIFKISTLGFRGEALPSIASVSNTIMRTKIKDFDYGREIAYRGGYKEYIKDVGLNTGTIIEVSDIFYNVPARQKFLKSPQREAALITDIVERIALANSKISFKLLNNSKKVVTTYSTDNLSDTIRSIYGKSIYENIFSFEKYSDIASVHGFIGNAEVSRGSRNNQSIFVNGRYIKSKLITTAVETAFKSFLTINKYPFFVLFLEIYPDFIDVNVHPTKSEIKFKDDRFIFKLVFDSVHEAVKKTFKSAFDFESEEISIASDADIFGKSIEESITQIQLPVDLNHDSKPQAAEFKIHDRTDKINQMHVSDTRKDIFTSEQNESITRAKVDGELKETSDLYNSHNENVEIKVKEPKFQALNVIGQLNNTYILTEGSEGLYIIDQHAAHEKILFEKYTYEVMNRKVTAQILMTPVVLELSNEDYLYYIENKEIFKETGFNIEIFGENTISIREVPIILGSIDIKNLFINILDNLKNMGSGKTAEVKYNKIATLACKSAIKANDSLSFIEMKALIDELRYIDDPFTCPHGRPTIIKITIKELEKRFKRIQ